MNEDNNIAATSLDWSTVVLKESEPPPARPAEDGLMTVLLGVVVLSIGGAILAAIPLLFAGATVALAPEKIEIHSDLSYEIISNRI